MTPTRSSAGSAPRTLRKPQAKLRAAVKSSPTGPREARRKVPLDGRAQRSYHPNHTPPHRPDDWVRKCGRSIKGSDTPQTTTASSPTLASSHPHPKTSARSRKTSKQS